MWTAIALDNHLIRNKEKEQNTSERFYPHSRTLLFSSLLYYPQFDQSIIMAIAGRVSRLHTLFNTKFTIKLVNQSICTLQRQVFKELTVNLQSRSRTTSGNTLSCLQRIHTIGGRLATFDPQALLQMFNQLITVAQIT